MINVLIFHQGWTDIINCLPIINYYSENYNDLNVVIRKDACNILKFYTKNLNIKIFEYEKNIIDSDFFNIDAISSHIKIPKNEFNILGIGCFDILRNDQYKDLFSQRNHPFEKCFYTNYGIDYINRINKFEFQRDTVLENNKYNEFINLHGKKYILYHQLEPINNSEFKKVNLDNISSIFFDMIKIFENAKEIFLIDSVWGVFIYLLDAKYRLFKDKKIICTCIGGSSKADSKYYSMFKDPVLLDNWKII